MKENFTKEIVMLVESQLFLSILQINLLKFIIRIFGGVINGIL
jgi:hypothetical protein